MLVNVQGWSYMAKGHSTEKFWSVRENAPNFSFDLEENIQQNCKVEKGGKKKKEDLYIYSFPDGIKITHILMHL